MGGPHRSFHEQHVRRRRRGGFYDEIPANGVEFPTRPKAERSGTAAIFTDADGNQLILSSRTRRDARELASLNACEEELESSKRHPMTSGS
jgi:hypothetical protein